MSSGYSCWLYLACVSSVVACGDEPSAEPVAKATWPSDFESAWPEVRDCRLSPAEHSGYYIRVFTNPEAEQAYLEGNYPFVPGTQLVKGEYDDEGCLDLARVSSMLKLAAGADPELGDWSWQQADAAGNVEGNSDPTACQRCHVACSNSDLACTDP